MSKSFSYFFLLFLPAVIINTQLASAQKVILQGFHVGRFYNGREFVNTTTHGVPCPLDKNSIVQTDTWHYDRLAKQANLIASSGFTGIWMPPMSKGNLGFSGAPASPRYLVGGIYDAGYGLYDDYDLGDKLQNGNYQTRYGSRTQLTRCVAMLRANGVDVYEDLILNHRSITPNAKPVAPDYMWYSYKNAYDSVGGGRFPKYTPDFHNPNQFPGAPGGKSDPNTPNLVFPDGTPTGAADGTFGPDFAHITGQRDVHGIKGVYCAEQLTRWGDWLMRATGIQGYRLDAVGGISWDWLKGFVSYGAMKDKFCFAELLTARYGPIHFKQWMNESMGQTGSNFTTYDFALQATLRGMCRTNQFWMGSFLTKHLSWGTTNEINPSAGSVNPGPWGIYRSSMVTAPTQSVLVLNEINTESEATALLPTQSLIGYAYILSIGYGTPIVSYKDWGTDADCYGSTLIDGNTLNYHLNKLIWCHKFLCTGDISNEYTSSNGHVYTFQKNGPNPAMVYLNSDQNNAVAANAPTSIPDGTVMVDYTDHNITGTVSGGRLRLTVPANKNGRGYLIMAAAGITGSFTPATTSVTQEWEANEDLSIPPATHTQQQVCRIWVDNGQTITSTLLDYNTANWTDKTNLHVEINKTSLDNKTHVKVASRTFNNNQKNQTLTYTAAADGPGYYSVWVKGNNLPDTVSNWWFRLQNTYTASKTAPENFNDTIATLVKARKVFIPDTVERNIDKIGLYPNPARGTVTTEYMLPGTADVRVRIVDISGKIMYSRNEGKRTAGKNKAALNVNGWVNGVYFVQVLADNKTLAAKKLVIAN